MLQPRSALRHNVDAHSTQRIEEPMPPLAKQSPKLAATKQQADLKAPNENTSNEHDASFFKSQISDFKSEMSLPSPQAANRMTVTDDVSGRTFDGA